MPGISDQARIKTFNDQLIAELYKIPTPAETAAFLTGTPEARQKIVRSCRTRAKPLIEMILALGVYSTID